MDNMLLHLIRELQVLVDSGEEYIGVEDLLKIAYSKSLADEWDARQKIILRIVSAKREAGFPLTSNFFRDVWPVVIKAYIERPIEPTE